jgi:hypothetical protein
MTRIHSTKLPLLHRELQTSRENIITMSLFIINLNHSSKIANWVPDNGATKTLKYSIRK